jgi:hypothetical protein
MILDRAVEYSEAKYKLDKLDDTESRQVVGHSRISSIFNRIQIVFMPSEVVLRFLTGLVFVICAKEFFSLCDSLKKSFFLICADL